MLTKQDLIDFEEDIKRDFLDAKIRYPVHFSKGNEDQLIQIFKENNIGMDSWVFSTHRSHYHALLKGIPKEWIKEQIYRGNSMHLMSKEYKFFASSIVGGCVSIAIGLAFGLKKGGLNERVFCFIGDMASTVGIYYECQKYALHFDLPINFIIECNGLSTNTPTYNTWFENHVHANKVHSVKLWTNGSITQYCYERQCPHINTLEFVEFK